MYIITSKQNDKIKFIKKLQTDKTFREKQGLAILEGEKMLGEVSLICDVFEIIKTESKLLKAKATTVSESVFKDISTQTTPDGVLTIFKTKNLKVDFKDLKLNKNFLVLDEINDPGNMGTILRTAVAAGVEEILLINNNVDLFSPKTMSASRGAIFKLKFCYVTRENLKIIAESKTLVSTTMSGGNLFEFEPDKNKIYAIVLGNEANGISEDIIDICQVKLTIPMHNTESLNVAVSGGIIMYHFAKMK